MDRRRTLIGTVIGLLLMGFVLAGCAESDPSSAETPADAETAPNNAPQTDGDGNTIPSDGAEMPMTDDGGGEPMGDGDAAAGEAVFMSASCSGCHLGNGNEAGGIGPQLAGMDLDDGGVRNVILNGRGAMPAGLVQEGEDLDNVVAWVLSLQ